MNKVQSKYKTNYLLIAGIVLVIIAIVLFLCFLLKGKSTVGGTWSEERSDYLSCEMQDKKYPFLEYDESQRRNTKVNIIFTEDTLKTISLIHSLTYENDKAIVDSENLNQAAMNEYFNNDGLGFNALNLKFTRTSSGLQISLLANADDINNNSAKYFLIDDINNNLVLNKMQALYEKQGFECKNNN